MAQKQKVVGQNTQLNPGSKTITRKTMNMKSNTKGVPVTPVMQPTTIGKDEGRTTSRDLPKHKKVGTHY